MILAIETSCDDTCAALVGRDGTVHANVISSQEIHDRFGGVVPEVAARRHLELIDPVLSEAFARARCTADAVEMVAATRGPGLVGALLVGFSAAKAFAAARELPLAAVDHLAGHVAAAYLEPAAFDPPFVALIASGGHTLLLDVRERDRAPEVLARTLDDAAGEAFDKGARMLGLGYPGGPALSALARSGDPEAHAFPTGRGEDFSFAGVKTALLYRMRELKALDEGIRELGEGARADLAASYQAAIVEALLRRTVAALERTGHGRLALGGGVAANSLLRERAGSLGVELFVPPLELCTDNAAMIASAALCGPPMPYPDYLPLDVYATGEGPLR